MTATMLRHDSMEKPSVFRLESEARNQRGQSHSTQWAVWTRTKWQVDIETSEPFDTELNELGFNTEYGIKLHY